MEKKRNSGLVIFLIILLIVLVTLVTLLATGVVKSPFIKESTSSTNETCTKCNTETTSIEDNSVQILRVNKDSLSKTEENELGTLKIGDKTYKATIKYDEEVNSLELWNVSVDGTKLEVNSADYIAVMDNSYIVVKDSGIPNSGIGYNLVIYDKNLNKVDKLNGVNSFRVLDIYGQLVEDVDITVTNKLNDLIIDKNNIVVYDCTEPTDSSNHNQDFVQKILNFENGKYTEKELLHVENVFCSSQR